MSNFISMDDLTQLRLCNGYYCFCFYLFWVFFQYYKHKKATTIACEENKFCDHRLIGLSLKLPRANCVPKLFIAVRSLQLRLTWTKKKTHVRMHIHMQTFADRRREYERTRENTRENHSKQKKKKSEANTNSINSGQKQRPTDENRKGRRKWMRKNMQQTHNSCTAFNLFESSKCLISCHQQTRKYHKAMCILCLEQMLFSLIEKNKMRARERAENINGIWQNRKTKYDLWISVI